MVGGIVENRPTWAKAVFVIQRDVGYIGRRALYRCLGMKSQGGVVVTYSLKKVSEPYQGSVVYCRRFCR